MIAAHELRNQPMDWSCRSGSSLQHPGSHTVFKPLTLPIRHPPPSGSAEAENYSVFSFVGND
jgi:hypothetical protein